MLYFLNIASQQASPVVFRASSRGIASFRQILLGTDPDFESDRKVLVLLRNRWQHKGKVSVPLGASHKSIHVRLDRHSRRRRMLLLSCDMAMNPSIYDEHIDEQILLDPELIKIVNASADYLTRRTSSSEILADNASRLVKGMATGSAVLADFPDVECEMVPLGRRLAPQQEEEEDPTSVFSDIPSQYSPEMSETKETTAVPQEPEVPEKASVSPAKLNVIPPQVGPRKSRRNINELLDSKPVGGTDGLNLVRSWLHESQSRVWMFVGDETTAWLRYHGEPGFAEMFRHRIRWELRRFPDLIVNAGVRNAGIDDLIKIARQGLLQCRADAVFIMPTIADVQLAVEKPFDYSERLRRLAEVVREQGAVPVFQTPPVPSTEGDESIHPLHQLADLVREVAIVEGFPLIDHAEFWQEQGNRDWWADDKSLISAAGQRALSMLFFSELDLFDRSSQLCSKLQSTWNNSKRTVPQDNAVHT